MPVLAANDNDFPGLLSRHERVVVKYYADWCGHCRLFAPAFAQLAAEPRYQGITFLAVNAEASPAARRLGGVQHLPYFATFYQGQRREAFTSTEPAEVAELLNRLLAAAP